jgi:hypothetical protein
MIRTHRVFAVIVMPGASEPMAIETFCHGAWSATAAVIEEIARRTGIRIDDLPLGEIDLRSMSSMRIGLSLPRCAVTGRITGDSAQPTKGRT